MLVSLCGHGYAIMICLTMVNVDGVACCHGRVLIMTCPSMVGIVGVGMLTWSPSYDIG